MTINGTISSIIYYSPESGYHILSVKTDDGIITVLVNCYELKKGESISLKGEFVYNSKYGKQFKAERVEKTEPNTVEAIENYLKSGLIKGVGEVTASLIVSTFKLESLNIIEKNPALLASIKGISLKKAFSISQEYNKNKSNSSVIMFLQDKGITLYTSLKIYKIYGDETIAVINSNPYRLIEDVDGIGFKTADKIALESGVTLNSPFRIKAGIIYSLKEGCDKNGNTFLYKDELIDLSSKILQISDDLIPFIEELFFEQKIKIITFNEKDAIYLKRVYLAEKGAASKLVHLMKNDDGLRIDLDEIALYQKNFSIDFNDEQIEAIKTSFNEPVSIITGGPGTGKTTIIKCLIHLLKQRGLSVTLLAPTGRAAKRMSESTLEEASTIHRAIMAGANQVKQLNCDVVIIDETSMLDIFLLNSLLKSIGYQTKLIMIGDKDQLPSVSAGNVLSDLLQKLPKSQLKQIYRQEKDSLIITNAHLINKSTMPILNEKDKDFFFIRMSNPQEMAKLTVDLVKNKLPPYLNTTSDKIQVLCPLKNGDVGTNNLNLMLCKSTENNGINQIKVNGNILSEGDKVMQTVNNYQQQWTRGEESGEGVFNGDVGTIVSIFNHTKEVEILFDDNKRAIYSDNLDELILAYAITVHKSQGSEYDAVIIPIASAYPYVIITKNLLYTAITRAKKIVVLIGEETSLKKIINNNYIARRNSGLNYFIDKAIKDYDKLFLLTKEESSLE